MEETLNILRLLLRMITRNKCPGLFQNTGTPDITGDSIPPQSFSVRLGICWGDDMRNIISSAKKKKVKKVLQSIFLHINCFIKIVYNYMIVLAIVYMLLVYRPETRGLVAPDG